MMLDLYGYFHEAANTLKASNWQLFKARWLGKKHVGHDSGCTVTIYEYKGIAYLIGCKHDEPPAGAKIERRA